MAKKRAKKATAPPTPKAEEVLFEEDDFVETEENTVTIGLDPATLQGINDLLLRHDARMRLANLAYRLREEGHELADELDSIIEALTRQNPGATDGDRSGRETG